MGVCGGVMQLHRNSTGPHRAEEVIVNWTIKAVKHPHLPLMSERWDNYRALKQTGTRLYSVNLNLMCVQIRKGKEAWSFTKENGVGLFLCLCFLSKLTRFCLIPQVSQAHTVNTTLMTVQATTVRTVASVWTEWTPITASVHLIIQVHLCFSLRHVF